MLRVTDVALAIDGWVALLEAHALPLPYKATCKIFVDHSQDERVPTIA